MKKVGIDTNILIKLYDQPMLFEYEEAKIFKSKDTIFTNKICIFELSNYIRKKKNIDIESAKKEAKEFIKQHNINPIYNFIPINEIDKFEKESNEKLSKINLYLKCHKPDSIILLSFKKKYINKIISTDEAFRRCAEFLEIKSTNIPSINATISRELRKLFDYKRKNKYRKR